MGDVWPDRLDLPLTGGSLAAISEEDWPIEFALSRDVDVTRWTFYPASLTETQLANDAVLPCRALERDGRSGGSSVQAKECARERAAQLHAATRSTCSTPRSPSTEDGVSSRKPSLLWCEPRRDGR